MNIRPFTSLTTVRCQHVKYSYETHHRFTSIRRCNKNITHAAMVAYTTPKPVRSHRSNRLIDVQCLIVPLAAVGQYCCFVILFRRTVLGMLEKTRTHVHMQSGFFLMSINSVYGVDINRCYI